MAMIYRLFGYKAAARRIVIQKSILAREGLLGLNKLLLNNAQTDIKKAMDILAWEANYPVLVHCSAGKDRTGLITALVQSLCGVSKEEIISDYSKSAELLGNNIGKMAARVGNQGLTPEFLESPPRVMEATLQYIQDSFGSVSLFLEKIGVSIEQQNKICDILIKKSKI